MHPTLGPTHSFLKHVGQVDTIPVDLIGALVMSLLASGVEMSKSVPTRPFPGIISGASCQLSAGNNNRADSCALALEFEHILRE